MGVWEQISGSWQNWHAYPYAASGKRFAIVVAKLTGDENGRQTRHILSSLEREFSTGNQGTQVDILSYPKELKSTGDTQNVLWATETARAHLSTFRADVVIWGEVAATDKVLRLRFTTLNSHAVTAKPYNLTDALELPSNFNLDFGAVLATLATIQIQPLLEKQGRVLAEILEPIAMKLRILVKNPPKGFSDNDMATLWSACADAEKQIGEERANNAKLQDAIILYNKALSVWTRERFPVPWATTKNNLGNALKVLSDRQRSTSNHKEAIVAYRDALQEWTQQRAPVVWAMLHSNLGLAFQALGERETGTEGFKEAVISYRMALTEVTRERFPVGWAVIQLNLGVTLSLLGERELGTKNLNEATSAFRESLKVFSRTRFPIYWAVTHINLGATLLRLGERDAGTERLREAIVAFRKALEVLKREFVPVDWGSAQANLCYGLQVLGMRENRTWRLRQAIGTCREALTVLPRNELPLQSAAARLNLGMSLLGFGIQLGSTDRLEEALTAFQEAQLDATVENFPFMWSLIQVNISETLKASARLQMKNDLILACSKLDSGRQVLMKALDVLRKSATEYYFLMAERRLQTVKILLASSCGVGMVLNTDELQTSGETR